MVNFIGNTKILTGSKYSSSFMGLGVADKQLLKQMKPTLFFKTNNRDVNGFIKNSLKMSGSRGRIGPGGVKGQRPCGGSRGGIAPLEKLNFHIITA